MTKHASTTWSSVLLGLALSGAAVAQTAPTDTTKDANDDGVTGDTSVNSSPDSQTNTQGTTPTPSTTTTGTDTDTTITPPADIDVNVYNPPPQPDTRDTTTYVAPTMMDDDDDDDSILSSIGFAIAAGGGTGGFVDEDLSDTADIGGEWDVRATIGTRTPIAFEGSYIGSAQGIDALGLDTNAVLVGNGVQGALRVNAPVDFPILPFAFGGAAWRRYDLTNTDTNLSDVAGSDDVLELPVGIGLGGRWNGLMLDARGEYRFSTDNDLLPVTANRGDFAEMDRWGVKGTVGVEF